VVGIVVVSHSRALAVAAVALAREMAGASVPIEVAAGLDETTFGTDATAIADAVGAADSGAGVVVLMDLGSAVLSADLALEMLPEDVRSRVLLCPAPLVEGLVAAAVTAAGGADRTAVAAEALASLEAKRAQVGGEPDVPSAPAPAPVDTADAVGVFEVANPDGLHARPAARLVREVQALAATVTLRNLRTGAGPVPAGSLSRVATLGLRRHDRAEVRAAGDGARAAVDAILALAARHFDEPVSGPPPVAPTTVAGPRPVSPGIAIGPLWTLERARVAYADLPATSAGPAAERDRLDGALAAARRELTGSRDRAPGQAADILDAHLMLLDDPEIRADVAGRLDAGQPAVRAWAGALDEVADRFAALEDAYLAQRAADARQVRDQVVDLLLGAAPGPAAAPEGGGVLVVADLTPAQAADLDPALTRGLVLARAGPTAHSAIIAATLGIPTVASAGAGVLDLRPGTLVALDGGTGEVVADPDAGTLAEFRRRAGEQHARAASARAGAHRPARTTDGVTIQVAANVGSLADAVAAAAAGADSVGLVRTEFLFLGRTAAPDVDEQEAAYRAIADALGGRRVTLRTLDVGGDKPLPYLPMPAEANPFLGVRGLRLALSRPELLHDQLRAMVRVARDAPVTVLLPMVTVVRELRAAREALDRVLAAEGRPAGLELGIMIEVPAAALRAGAFAPYVDVFSIGTNDLTQYTLAAERGNPAVAGLADPLDPAVLTLIDAVCRAGPTPVAVCGELAADEQATALLVGLGVRELSVAPAAVPRIKAHVRELSAATARDQAAAALDAPTAETTRARTARAED
jgi:multiphosphoryl transfer protein